MPKPAEHPILAHARQVRQAILKRDAQTLNRLTRDYLQAYQSLKAEIDALAQAAQEAANKGDLLRLAALRNLQDGIRVEIGRFANHLAGQLESAAAMEIQQAGLDAFGFVQAGLPGFDEYTLSVGWSRLSPNQVYQMFAFTDPSGPLYSNLRLHFGSALSDLATERLMQGFVVGMHATEIARLIRQATGMGLNWALNTARTATLWAYRSATHLTYQRNSQVVRGWIWWSARDRRTCMSCIALHGSQHSLSEMLADHHSGRCVAAPVLASWDELGIPGVPDEPLQVERGEDWFKHQPADRQRAMMGPAKYRAWQAGAFQLSQLSQTYYDPVYGKMWREASLKSILGDKAELYYGQ